MAARPPRDPLVVVIGATGTGKSKLAVELATKFNGEIINGDAMQMYQGLPITTNKIPEHERNGIVHHLIDFIRLEEKPWTVVQFMQESSRVIQKIRSRGKLPILVGGTHYYTQALLFKDATLGDDQSRQADIDSHSKEDTEPSWPILSAPTEEIFARLKEVDPIMAGKWHPKDRRHIQRSLEIWLKTGRKASDVYAEQEEARSMGLNEDFAENHASRPQGLRYPTLLLWLEAEDKFLKERLNKRVDLMVEQGLCKEALAMADIEEDLLGRGTLVDKSKGIWVSIGYRQLQPWISQIRDTTSDELAGANPTTKLLHECIESIKAGTRQYAKRQHRYIRIRLANALKDNDALDRLFLFDCTNLNTWEESVTNPSQTLVQNFLDGSQLPHPHTLSKLASEMFSMISQEPSDNRAARHCEICKKTLMTEKEWAGHLTSRSHKKVAQIQRRRLGQDSQLNGTEAERVP